METLPSTLMVHRPVLYAEIARNHILAVVQSPPEDPINKKMAGLQDLVSITNATLDTAGDIPVPYYPDQEPKKDWMALRREVVKDFLRQQKVYLPSIRRAQPNPEPATDSLTAKGKERAVLPTVKTESAANHGLPFASSIRDGPADLEGSAGRLLPTTTPAVAALPTDCATFVNLAARAKALHINPRAPSIEYLASRHPDDTDDNGSSDEEPSASKQPRLVSPTPSPHVPLPNYLALTPSEIDCLLHDTRPFQHWFVYTPNHIRGIANDIFRELSTFLSFYAPALEQEAVARIYLYRAFQSHFNRQL
ncbi:hypothetical protein PCANC_23459 [Puccinia coronata f. sp. avenae]|uniref:Uncharacterized protein n=1 Tax=Puccinia coronata f. sp. avenae TaxID=200324 RepID=A0A2N5UL91_9BASI|nr:hypothetical protein PCANC_23459 [Puccinia coronata f. sp. avenae]